MSECLIFEMVKVCSKAMDDGISKVQLAWIEN